MPFKINAVTKTLYTKISEKLRHKQVKFPLNKKIKIKIFRIKVLLIQAHPYPCATGLIELENCGKLLMKS